MKRNKKIILLAIALIISILIELFLYRIQLFSYSLIVIALIMILSIYLITYILETKDEEAIYKSTLKKALKNYDAIMVESQKIPDLKDKNIIRVTNIDNLIDAQVEIRKPIYYINEGNSCSFVLLDNKEACVFILKLNDEVVSPLETMIDELDNSKYEDLDLGILEDIDKTTIIRLSNKKTLKVSPYRKENEEKTEELSEAPKIEEENDVPIITRVEDIEII